MKTFIVYYEPVLHVEVQVADEEDAFDAINKARALIPMKEWESAPDDFKDYRAEEFFK